MNAKKLTLMLTKKTERDTARLIVIAEEQGKEHHTHLEFDP